MQSYKKKLICVPFWHNLFFGQEDMITRDNPFYNANFHKLIVNLFLLMDNLLLFAFKYNIIFLSSCLLVLI